MNTSKSIKIYGERNTGTNYLKRVLELNFQAILLGGDPPMIVNHIPVFSEVAADIFFAFASYKNLGWKHTLIRPERLARLKTDQEIYFLTITKNPYSWLLSLYNRPYHARKKYASFDEFLKSPWEVVFREQVPGYFKNPMDIWNRKNAAYIELGSHRPALTLRYEDLLDDPSRVLSQISQRFSIPYRSSSFANMDESTKGESGKDFGFYRDYYLQERWKQKLNPEQIQYINEYLDEKVMEHFSYPRLK